MPHACRAPLPTGRQARSMKIVRDVLVRVGRSRELLKTEAIEESSLKATDWPSQGGHGEDGAS